MASINVKTLKSYMAAELNIIISGVHGVGKTAKLKEAADQLGLTMKYYSASTLDSFTDLTGIPVPDKETKTVEYYRPKAIDEADVVFFDEFNRADQRTLNTLFELIQSRSINGERLPKLKCVVAAMNPVTEEYSTEQTDAAIMDRFDIFLQADPEADLGYFIKKFGDRVGKAAVELWSDYHRSYMDAQSRGKSNSIAYISPRRMEKITSAFVAIPARQTIVDSLPPEIIDRSVAANWFRVLNQAVAANTQKDGSSDVSEQVHRIVSSSIAAQRSALTGQEATRLLEEGKLSDNDKNRLLNSLAASLNSAKGVGTIWDQFGTVVKAMNATHYKILTDGWAPAKSADLQKRIAASI